MWYVYFLESKRVRNWVYVGSTNDLRRRTDEHFQGGSVATKPYLPLKLKAYIAVTTESRARSLEKYCKVGSGKSIIKKRILADEA